MILTDDEIRKAAEFAAAQMWPESGYVGWTEDDAVFHRKFIEACFEKLRAGVELPEAFAHAAYEEYPSYEGVGDIVYYHPNAKPANCIDLFTLNQLLQYGAAQRLAAREQQWLPIESAPKDGTEILLYSLGDVGVCYWRDDEVMTGWTWGLGKAFGLPTHWQPLPPTPTSPQEQT